MRYTGEDCGKGKRRSKRMRKGKEKWKRNREGKGKWKREKVRMQCGGRGCSNERNTGEGKKGIIDGEKEEGEEEITHSQGEKTAGEGWGGEGRR